MLIARCMDPVYTSFQKLHGKGLLDYYGFITRFEEITTDHSLEHPAIVLNHDMAQLGGNYALRLYGIRLKRTLSLHVRFTMNL